MELLNHEGKGKYSLPVIANLSEESFALLYQEAKKLFISKLVIRSDDKIITTNARFPTQQQAFQLIKHEFIETRLNNHQDKAPYP